MMKSAEAHINGLIYECDSIIDGDYTDDETQKHIDGLMTEMEGFSYLLGKTGGLDYLKERDIDGVRRIKGWLECNMVLLVEASPATVSTHLNNIGNSSASANASASSTVSISQAMEAIDGDTSLTEEQKAEIQTLLAEAKAAAVKKDKGMFAKIGSKTLECLEEAGPTLMVKVLEFLATQALGLTV